MIYLIRHGQTQANVLGQYVGHQDSPLTQTGQEQHAAVLAQLDDTKFDRIYTSPSERCAMLADTLADANGIQAARDTRILEFSFGIFEGLTYEQAKEAHPESWSDWVKGSSDFALPDGESIRAFETRVKAFAGLLKESRSVENIAAVTHGGVIGSLICCSLSLNIAEKWRFKAENGTVVRIQITHDGFAYLVL